MQYPWLNSYPKGIPAEINPDVFPSLQAMMASTVQHKPHNIAVTNFGVSLTYSELDQQANALAAYWQSLGLTKGDRVAVMLPNVIQYYVVLFAAFKIGLVVVNVNPLYTAYELQHQVNDAQPRAIIVLENFAKTLQDALAQCSVEHIVITRFADAFPLWKRCLGNFIVKHVSKMVPAYNLDKARSYQYALKQGRSLPLLLADLQGDDLAFLQYTGGTTGVPKGAMLTHRNMVANVEQAYAWMQPQVNYGEEIMVTALPLYHIFSLLANCLVFIRAGSQSVLVTNPRDMDRFIKILKKHQFTAITGVNTLFNGLLNHARFKEVDFSHLKFALGGGMALQRTVAERWEQLTDSTLCEAYGLTETSPAVTINPLDLAGYNGSIGLPIPSTVVKIVDEHGSDLPQGGRGELCVKGPQVMRGYWQRPEETEQVLQDGWFKTGDIAEIDHHGFVYLVDRKKDMVDVSGFNVYPNEVEDIIARHPQVVEVAVVGVPYEKTGEALKAFIVPKQANLGSESIRSFCRDYLTKYKVPKFYEFCDDLPKNNVGKILRRELRQRQQSEEGSFS